MSNLVSSDVNISGDCSDDASDANDSTSSAFDSDTRAIIESASQAVSSIINNQDTEYVTLDGCSDRSNVCCIPTSLEVKRGFKKLLPKGWRFQSHTSTGKYTLVSAYDKNRKNNSRLYIFDSDGNNLGYISLDIKSHVGGISYDSNHNRIYVTNSKGNICYYDLDINEELNKCAFRSFYKKCVIDLSDDSSSCNSKNLLNINNVSMLNDGKLGEFSALSNKSYNNKAATAYYANDKLYVATFSVKTKIYQFDISYVDGEPVVDESSAKIVSQNLGPAVQGIASYDDESGQQYVLVSQSYSKNDSCIIKYKVKSDGTYEFVGQKVLDGDPGVEGLSVVDGVVYCNFENVSSRKDGGEKIYSLSVDDISGASDDIQFVRLQAKLFKAAEKYSA